MAKKQYAVKNYVYDRITEIYTTEIAMNYQHSHDNPWPFSATLVKEWYFTVR